MDGLLVQTLVETQHVKNLLVCRNSLGKQTVVHINDYTIACKDGVFKLPRRIVGISQVTIGLEDVIFVSLTNALVVALRVVADQGPAPIHRIHSKLTSFRSDSQRVDQYICSDPTGSVLATCTLEGEIIIRKLYSSGLKHPLNMNPNHRRLTSERTLFMNIQRVILGAAFLFVSGPDVFSQYFVVLYAARNGMLCLEMVPIRCADVEFSMDKNTTKLPFTASSIPLFTIPVKSLSGLLLILSKELLFINMSDIMSGNTEYLRYNGMLAQDDGFKYSSYFYDAATDTVYLSHSHDGRSYAIYTIDIDEKSIVPTLLARFPDLNLGCTFVLEAFDPTTGVTDEPLDICTHFLITYGGDYVPITKLIFSRELDLESHPLYMAFVADDIEPSTVSNNMSPIYDGQLILYGPELKETLFVCSGIGENGSLTRVNTGHKAEVFLNGPSLGPISDMYSVKDARGLQYLFMSYPWGTQIYLVSENSGESTQRSDYSMCDDNIDENSYLPILEPVPDDSGFIVNSSTKTVHVLPNSLQVLQVTESNIVLTDGEYHSVSHVLPGKITHAAAQANVLAVTLHSGSEFSLHLFGLKPANFSHATSLQATPGNDWIQSLNPNGPVFKSSVDITFIKVFNGSFTGVDGPTDTKIVALGGYDRIISLYTLAETTRTLEPFCQIPAGISNSNDLTNDFELLSTRQNTLKALASQRGGTYCYFEVDITSGAVLSSKSYSVGESPVSFLKLNNSNILVRDDTHLICVKPDELYRPVAVYFHSNDAYGTGSMRYKRSIPCLCEITVNNYWGGHDHEKTFLAISINGRVKFITVSKKPQLVTRCIAVGHTPRRMLHLEYLHAFAVALDSSSATSRIAFVDPNKERVLQTMEDRCDFDSDEIIYSLFQWCVLVDSQEYRFLVVGSSSARGTGKIRVIRLKRMAKGVIHMKLITKWRTEGPVYSIVKMSDKSFAYCENRSLQLATLKICGQDQIKIDRGYFYKDRISAVGFSCAPTGGGDGDDIVNLYIREIHSPIVHLVRFKNSILHDQDDNSAIDEPSDGLNDQDELISKSDVWWLIEDSYNAALGHCALDEETVLVSYPDRGLDLVKLRTGYDGLADGLYPHPRVRCLPSIVTKFIRSTVNPSHVIGLSSDGTIYGFTCLSKEQLQQIKEKLKESKASNINAQVAMTMDHNCSTVVHEETLRGYTHESGWNVDLLSAITL